jgi:hypothetical protein
MTVFSLPFGAAQLAFRSKIAYIAGITRKLGLTHFGRH